MNRKTYAVRPIQIPPTLPTPPEELSHNKSCSGNPSDTIRRLRQMRQELMLMRDKAMAQNAELTLKGMQDWMRNCAKGEQAADAIEEMQRHRLDETRASVFEKTQIVMEKENEQDKGQLKVQARGSFGGAVSLYTNEKAGRDGKLDRANE